MNNVNILKQYEDFMQTSKFYPQDKLPITYPALGLNGEAGEVAEKVKKCWRDNNGIFDDNVKKAILKELADTLWYIWACADDMGYTLEDVLQTGITKVKERQETNTVHGNGDDREKKKESFIANTPVETSIQIEESIDNLPKRILAVTTDSFDELKELYYKMKFINRSGKVDLTIVQHITKNMEVHNEVHTYKGKFKGIGRIDGAILIQLNNESDITEIIQILSENDTSNYYDFMINETTVSCPKVQELPLVYI
jgi:NTP pyrophosphatase (non-canonical NTP hydrolase)